MASTSVVLPWSTWAMIATFLISLRVSIDIAMPLSRSRGGSVPRLGEKQITG
jgi:hypothetical protein